MEKAKIPADKIPEIFDRAARLYAENNHSYSVEEIIQAGLEARIPPECIKEAIAQVQAQPKNKHSARKLLCFSRTRNAVSIAVAFILGILLTATIAEMQPISNKIANQIDFLETDLEKLNLLDLLD